MFLLLEDLVTNILNYIIVLTRPVAVGWLFGGRLQPRCKRRSQAEELFFQHRHLSSAKPTTTQQQETDSAQQNQALSGLSRRDAAGRGGRQFKKTKERERERERKKEGVRKRCGSTREHTREGLKHNEFQLGRETARASACLTLILT